MAMIPFVGWAATGGKLGMKIVKKGGAKLISQFSISTIDKAVALTMKQEELHIFANKLHPKPWLNQLSAQLGATKM